MFLQEIDLQRLTEILVSELQELRSKAAFEMGPEGLVKPARGRLVSTFLLSFIDENAMRA